MGGAGQGLGGEHFPIGPAKLEPAPGLRARTLTVRLGGLGEYVLGHAHQRIGPALTSGLVICHSP